MIPLKQPNNWSCLITSFAMILEVPVSKLVSLVGHDGSEEWWQHLPEPLRRRSFHVQELILASWHLGYAVTEFQFEPSSTPLPGLVTPRDSVREGWPKTIEMISRSSDGVLLGRWPGRSRHAVAISNNVAIDPMTGDRTNLADFEAAAFYAVTDRIKS